MDVLARLNALMTSKDTEIHLESYEGAIDGWLDDSSGPLPVRLGETIGAESVTQAIAEIFADADKRGAK